MTIISISTSIHILYSTSDAQSTIKPVRTYVQLQVCSWVGRLPKRSPSVSLPVRLKSDGGICGQSVWRTRSPFIRVPWLVGPQSVGQVDRGPDVAVGDQRHCRHHNLLNRRPESLSSASSVAMGKIMDRKYCDLHF